MNKKRNQYSFEFTEVLEFLLKWKKHLLLICLAAAIISYIASSPFFITPKYESSTIFYPSWNNSISNALLSVNKTQTRDYMQFGDEEMDEQYLQLLYSGALGARIVSKFNLMEHYKIDQDAPDKMTRLFRTFRKNVNYSRTNYNSIEVAVRDEDPKMAADIANAIVENLDTVKREIQSRIGYQVLTIVEAEYGKKRAEVDSLKDKIRELGAKGMYHLGEQAQGVTEASAKGGGSSALEKEKSMLAQYAADREELDALLTFEVANLSDLKRKVDLAKVDVEGRLSYVFVINRAYPSESKAYPIRYIIVAFSVLSAFFLGCVALVLLEKVRQYRNNQTV